MINDVNYGINLTSHSLGVLTGLTGKSEAIRDIIHRIIRLKDIDATILITGESGCGKELVARALHKLSKRAEHGSFEAINCGALPENLIESELFGHKKGSFTDAKVDKKGLFELYDHGTLFLDEIGDLPLPVQGKLLRVLQEKEIRPVGGSQTLKINTRVIAATNKDLFMESREKRFREDLYYRLSVFVFHVPPLRERREDIPLLFKHFFDYFCLQYKKVILTPSHSFINALMEYHWPGNVRELKNSVERAVVMAQGQELLMSELIGESDVEEHSSQIIPYDQAKDVFEKAYLNQILKSSKGNIALAAKLSGKFRSDIYRMMKRHQIYFSDENTHL